MDVVEIDPKMPKIAQEYFHLEDSPRLTTFHEDGRIFLNKNTNKYDAIFIDAFKSYMAPFQLTTKEAVEKISSSLADDGVVLVNIVSAIEGEQGQFLRAEYATYKTAFPQVHIFRVIFPFPNLTQNLMLVATKANTPINLNNDDKILAGYLEHYFDGEVETDLPVLVDDYAPVEKYMAGISK